MKNSKVVLVLSNLECQLSDWSVTTEEDGHSQEYINGRIDALKATIRSLHFLQEIRTSENQEFCDIMSGDIDS